MDQLSKVLESTFSSNYEERKNAEIFLAQFDSLPGYHGQLFQLINTPQVDLSIRQAGVIRFRHVIDRNWSNVDKDVKALIKGNIVQSIASAPKVIRVQMELVLSKLVQSDFPSEWPDFLPQLIQLISSQNPINILGSLIAIRTFINTYTVASKKSALYNIVDTLFPVLTQLFQFLLNNNNSMESVEIQIMVCKIFWAATQMDMPPYFLPERLQPWLDMFLFLLQQPVPLQNEPRDQQIRQKWPPWLVKKWSGRIFDRIFHRYGNPRENELVDQGYCQFFMKNYSLRILETIFNLLNGDQAKRFPNKVTTACLNYINTSIYPSYTWNVVKAYMERLFQSVLFPILYFTEEDAVLYEQDPHEFIKRQFDFTIIMHDPRSAVLSIMSDVIPLRGPENTHMFMNYIVNTVLARHLNAPPNQKNLSEKDAALVAIGNLVNQLKSSKQYYPMLEGIIVQHVLPEFNSPHGFMRSRACWIFGQFSDLKFQNESNFLLGAQMTIQCLRDKDLPVRINSAITLKSLIRSKLVAPLLEAVLPQVLEAYLKLMDEIDNEDLIEALQTLIERYSDQITNFAPTLIKNLTEQYMRLIQNKGIFSGKDQTSMLTAIQCLNAIKTVIDALENSPQILKEILMYIQPLLMTLCPELTEVILDYIHILAQYSYFVDTIDDHMWLVFGKFAQACLEWAQDFLPEMFIPFDNFITKSSDKFLSNNYLPIFYKLFEMAMHYKENIEWSSPTSTMQSVMVSGTKVMELALVHCRGKTIVDEVIPAVIQLTTEKLRTTNQVEAKVVLLQVIANALYCNPVVTLMFIESKDFTHHVFTLWFSLLNNFNSLHDIKATILGLSSLFYVPQMPQSVRAELKSITITILDLLQKYLVVLGERADQLRERELKDEAKAEASDDEDSLKFCGENQNVRDDEDIDADIFPTPILAKFQEMYDGGELSEGEDDEIDFTTCFDNIDEMLFFLDAFQAFSQRDSGTYQQLWQSFSETEKTRFNELVIEAKTREENS